jgi:hypothetical protein
MACVAPRQERKGTKIILRTAPEFNGLEAGMG